MLLAGEKVIEVGRQSFAIKQTDSCSLYLSSTIPPTARWLFDVCYVFYSLLANPGKSVRVCQIWGKVFQKLSCHHLLYLQLRLLFVGSVNRKLFACGRLTQIYICTVTHMHSSCHKLLSINLVAGLSLGHIRFGCLFTVW